MRKRTILTLSASTLLVACAHQGGPATLPGMAWSLHHSEGEGVKLAYGQPASDNVLLMMTCAPKSGQVALSLAGPADGAASSIELASGGARSRMAAVSAPYGPSSGSLLEASAPMTSPALAGFARSGQLAIVENGRAARLPVRATERGAVRGFFASCRA